MDGCLPNVPLPNATVSECPLLSITVLFCVKTWRDTPAHFPLVNWQDRPLPLSHGPRSTQTSTTKEAAQFFHTFGGKRVPNVIGGSTDVPFTLLWWLQATLLSELRRCTDRIPVLRSGRVGRCQGSCHQRSHLVFIAVGIAGG